jgi:hypothetical protein
VKAAATGTLSPTYREGKNSTAPYKIAGGEPIRDCLPLTTILHALVRGHCCHDASLLDAALGPDAIDAIVATLAV